MKKLIYTVALMFLTVSCCTMKKHTHSVKSVFPDNCTISADSLIDKDWKNSSLGPKPLIIHN